MAKPKPERNTEIVSIEAGCHSCGDTTPRWTAKNSMAVAAVHARRHAHYTWCRQSIHVRYGKPGTEFDIPFPGLRIPVPVPVQEPMP